MADFKEKFNLSNRKALLTESVLGLAALAWVAHNRNRSKDDSPHEKPRATTSLSRKIGRSIVYIHPTGENHLQIGRAKKNIIGFNARQDDEKLVADENANRDLSIISLLKLQRGLRALVKHSQS
jgi:hypothetical protein